MFILIEKANFQDLEFLMRKKETKHEKIFFNENKSKFKRLLLDIPLTFLHKRNSYLSFLYYMIEMKWKEQTNNRTGELKQTHTHKSDIYKTKQNKTNNDRTQSTFFKEN